MASPQILFKVMKADIDAAKYDVIRILSSHLMHVCMYCLTYVWMIYKWLGPQK